MYYSETKPTAFCHFKGLLAWMKEGDYPNRLEIEKRIRYRDYPYVIKRDVLPSTKPGAHKNTASTDVWAVQRVIAAMSGSLSTQ